MPLCCTSTSPQLLPFSFYSSLSICTFFLLLMSSEYVQGHARVCLHSKVCLCLLYCTMSIDFMKDFYTRAKELPFNSSWLWFDYFAYEIYDTAGTLYDIIYGCHFICSIYYEQWTSIFHTHIGWHTGRVRHLCTTDSSTALLKVSFCVNFFKKNHSKSHLVEIIGQFQLL